MATVEHRAPLAGPALAAAMARPETYPGRPEPVEVRETHISWVFLAGDRAYKLKKPVGCRSWTTGPSSAAREMCDEEMRLNRRLAPRVYLGVKAVVPTADGVALAPAHDPRAIDYVVEMRRFDEAPHARRHASPTAACPTRRSSPSAAGSRRSTPPSRRATATTPRPRSSTRSTRTPRRCSSSRPTRTSRARPRRSPASPRRSSARAAASSRPAPPPGASATATATCAPSTSCSSTASRSSTASSSTPRCAITDVGCDLAFLAMDLEALGAPFARAHGARELPGAGGDPGDDALLAFFGAYRALVRAKVALVRAGQADDRDRRIADARARLALAERLAWRVRRPGLVIVAGLSATGKTTLADLLADALGAARTLGSDAVRKQLLGIAPAARAGAAAYGRASTAAPTPSSAASRVRSSSARGGVIVDATFRNRADRAAFLDELGGLPDDRDGRRVPRARSPSGWSGRAARHRRAPCRTPTPASCVARPRTASWPRMCRPPGTLSLRTDRPPEDVLDDLAALLDARLGPGIRSSPRRRAGSCGWPIRRPAIASASVNYERRDGHEQDHRGRRRVSGLGRRHRTGEQPGRHDRRQAHARQRLPLRRAPQPGRQRRVRDLPAQDSDGAARAAARAPTATRPSRSRRSRIRHPRTGCTSSPRSEDAGLIVVGSTHTGRAGRVLPGSTAERLLHGSPCPVAVAPKGYAHEATPASPGSSVAATTEPRPRTARSQSAHRIAAATGARLRVIRAFQPLAYDCPPRRASPMGGMRLQRHAAGARPEELDEAVASSTATRAASRSSRSATRPRCSSEASEELDLLVVGSRGYGPLHSVLVGGVAGRVVREAACPVIVLPRKAGHVRGGLAVRRGCTPRPRLVP